MSLRLILSPNVRLIMNDLRHCYPFFFLLIIFDFCYFFRFVFFEGTNCVKLLWFLVDIRTKREENTKLDPIRNSRAWQNLGDELAEMEAMK